MDEFLEKALDELGLRAILAQISSYCATNADQTDKDAAKFQDDDLPHLAGLYRQIAAKLAEAASLAEEAGN